MQLNPIYSDMYCYVFTYLRLYIFISRCIVGVLIRKHNPHNHPPPPPPPSLTPSLTRTSDAVARLLVQSYRRLPVIARKDTPGVTDDRLTPGCPPQFDVVAVALSLCTPVSAFEANVNTRGWPVNFPSAALAAPANTPGVTLECPVCLLQRMRRAKRVIMPKKTL